MAGALTGANAALGLNILYGANVAIDEHNKANPDCQVTIKQFDTEGDAQKATQVAPQIVGDPTILGLLGPAFSTETEATGPIFFQAGSAVAHRVGHQDVADHQRLDQLLPRPGQ